MAFVVARRGGRFEIRESLHTANGPRSRTLAGFAVLTDEILAAATRRAQRPFDEQAVVGSARRAGARVQVVTSGASRTRGRFVDVSKRMASSLAEPQPGARGDPGAALLELLGFADMVKAGQPPRPSEPLAYPALARLPIHGGGVALAQQP